MGNYDMYNKKIRVDLTDLNWNDGLWEKFIDSLCRRSCKIEAGKTGEVFFLKNNASLSDYQIQTFVRSFVSEFFDREQPYPQFETGEPGRARLRVTPNVDSSTYLFYSTRLAALQMVPEIAEWILQYFLNIKFIYRENSDDYFFFDEEIDRVMDKFPCSYRQVDEEGGIIACIRGNLDRGQYVTVHLDEYYIPSKDYYGRAHHVNESLFYGYDDVKQLCYAYGFAREQHVTCFTVGYREVAVAYEKGKVFSFFGGGYPEEGGRCPVLAFRPRDPLPYRLTPWDFCNKLSEYLLPRSNQLLGSDFYVYGYNVVQEIIQNLRSDSLSDFMDYRAINLLYEHKRAVRRRLLMLEVRFWMPDYLPELFLDYDRIIFAFRGIQIIYLEQSMRESGLWNYEKRVRSRGVRQKTAERLEQYSCEEQELLWRIKEGLEEL